MCAPLVVAAQRGQRLPQVAGRQAAELLAQPPDEPPLSATVTTAVRSSTDAGAARTREAASPWPPPSATALTSSSRSLTRAPGRGGRRAASTPTSRSRRGDLLGHRDAAVLAAGAADRDGHEALALAEVAAADVADERDEALQELGGAAAAAMT